MSFGFGGGGFGSGNQQQTSGFGSGSAFGGTGSGGFGSNTQNQANPLFGGQNRPAFGSNTASTGGSLFGGNTATSGGGGFGGFGSTGSGAGGFGGNTGTATGGGIFGNKTGGFGGSTGSTGAFGAGAGPSTGFGAGTATTGFGGGAGTALQQGPVPPSDGTGSTPFNPFTEKDGTSTTTNHYQSISFMQPYSKYSFEELRLGDYNQGRRYGNGSGQAGAFGSSAFGGASTGGFGQQPASGFGTTSTPFGGAAATTTTSAPSAFGQTTPQTTGAFGSTTGTNSLFGAQKPATSMFGGGTNTATSQPSLFGSTAAAPATGFGTGAGTTGATGFGTGATGSLFGNAQQQQQPQQQTKSLFGSSTGTGTTGFGGGFGTQQQAASTTTTPFGGAAAAASPFGGAQQTTGTGAFGAFGQQNQAQTQNKGLFGGGTTGGAFGGAAQQQQPAAAGGGLFGGSTTGAGSSLFGGQNPAQQQQQQPAAGGGLFGNTAQQTGTGSLFGGAQQQQQQPKPGGLFGSSTTAAAPATGGFSGFGNPQAQQTGTGGLFGNTQTQQQQQQQQKPGGLFGSTTGTGGSLFGQPANAQPVGSSLFGNTQTQQQPAGGGLGGTGSLFGSIIQPAQQQAAPGSLQASLLEGNPYGNQSIFSGLPAPNAPSPGPLATPLSSSVKQKQRTPLPVYKITPSAANRLITPAKRQGYGFSYSTYGSPTSATSTPGGLGNSLLGGGVGGGGGGSLRGSVGGSFGRSFSKSFSTSNLRKTFDPETDSILSPGALSTGSSRLSSGNLKRLTIDRSLRNDIFSRPASTPAALTAAPAITNGSEEPSSTTTQPAAADKLKKKVSFDSTSPKSGEDRAATTTGGEVVLVQSTSPEPTPEELGFLRSVRKSTSVNGINGILNSTGSSRPSEMEEVILRPSQDHLPAVPEDAEHSSVAATTNGSRLPFTPGGDPQPGEYWMKPSRAEINKMSRDQQKHVVGFTVGRQRCGSVTFDEPVDLTTVDLDQIFGGLVEIRVRSITVYPDEGIKPPVGKGLNVPSILRIENSWPRGRGMASPSPLTSGPLFEKHVDRLRKVHNAAFIDYEKTTGTWIFKVPHFTTYGLDYDDEDEDEEEEGESLNHTILSAAPDTPTPKALSPNMDHTATFDTDDSFLGSVAGIEDDTFDFKKRKIVPGSFGNQVLAVEEEDEEDDEEEEEYDDDDVEEEEEEEEEQFSDESFLGEGSTGSTIEQDDDITESQQSGDDSEVESDEDREMDMAGAFPNLHHTVEHDDTTTTTKITDLDMDTTQRSLNPFWNNTPAKSRLNLSGDWAEQLQRTISPRKQNRDALREIQANAFHDRPLRDDDDTPKEKKAGPDVRQKGFTTSIDLMNSLFQQSTKQAPLPPRSSPLKKQTVPSKGFEWPYHKQPKTAGESNELTESDLAFHHSFKPRWGPMDTFICAKNDMRERLPDPNEPWEQGISVTSEGRDIVLLAFNKPDESCQMLDIQKRQSVIHPVDGVPLVRLVKAEFQQLAQLPSSYSTQLDRERLVWQLANVLFNDELEDDISAGVPAHLRAKYLHRIKKDRLSRLWEGIVREKHAHDLERIVSAEERAVHLLCSHRVEEACKTLLEGGNLHLATLLSQIGRDATVRADMKDQVDSWRQNNVDAEMSEPIRALYGLLAGNTVGSEGKSAGALEDRVSSFTLTERFELDWFQAFGLRLWYGITDDEPIEHAVAQFFNHLAGGDETAFPYPAHLDATREQPPPPSSEDTIGRESPLWVLLKAYSVVTAAAPIGLPAIQLPLAVLPEAVTGDRLSNRFSFQLHSLLTAALGQNESIQVHAAQADSLVCDFAWELNSTGAIDQALFVLLHLSQAADRERAVKETLARFAARLPQPLTAEGSPDAFWQYLTVDLQLPEAWIWVAKALYARTTGDATAEVDCLVRGKNWNDAHTTFCRIVGPTAVIERDYATLETLLSGFGEGPDRKVRGWARGGGVYEDFLRLATARPGNRDPVRLNRLVHALVAMGDKVRQGSGVEGLEERVAFKEMSRAVAGWTAQDDAKVFLLSLYRWFIQMLYTDLTF
ncbi:hypothetical protein ASPZODRAFT_1385725 [Penicilliopsis zonata CBS 506.65]|uniref:Peptidase S59 domain-containing protein n=1 Tax=Penicilliopsis zonata CBS 506.65 TaxID=1073090 RepID=A0A1L9SPK5_9EURO|nr:hypothetical protein ASPZODRAFT_1385725 [Penicilliopsis zonata CBS 506.65]OJJ49056.1 hypothetical protein ASPZODRAFT_1385725 [Penicilliopsis zonata CBS 506.65]